MSVHNLSSNSLSTNDKNLVYKISNQGTYNVNIPSGAYKLTTYPTQIPKINGTRLDSNSEYISIESQPTQIDYDSYQRFSLGTSTSYSAFVFATSTIRSMTYGTLFVAGGNSGALATSTDAITWTARTSGFGTSDILALTFGNSLYVAGGAGGAIRTSLDAITWTARTSGTTSAINAVAFGNGIYLAGGAGGNLRTSTNGTTWTTRTSGFGTTAIYALAYGASVYIAGGSGGTITTSTDGITWTTRTSGTTSQINAIVYGNGIFLAVGQSENIRTSTDAITWTARTSPLGSTDSIFSAVYNTSVFAIGADNGKLATSTDGITWTLKTTGLSASDSFRAMAYGNGITAFSFLNYNLYATDLTITSLYTNLRNANDIHYVNSLYIAAQGIGTANTDNQIVTSANGSVWTPVFGVNGLPLLETKYLNNTYIVSGDSMYSSTDTVTWTTRLSSTAVRTVTYGNGLYVAAGASGYLTTSTDLVTWTNRTSGFGTSTINGVEYGSGLYGNVFVAVGNTGTVTYSFDGVTWTAGTSGTTNILNSVTYGNNKFVAVGDTGKIIYSVDGISWSTASYPTTANLTHVKYESGLFIATGAIILTSTDGIAWSSQGAIEITAFTMLDNGSFVTYNTTTDQSTLYESVSAYTEPQYLALEYINNVRNIA